MPAIYADGFYVIIDDDTDIFEVPQNDLAYKENSDRFSIHDRDKKDSATVILFTDATSWDDDDSGSTQYTESTLRAFLRANTGS